MFELYTQPNFQALNGTQKMAVLHRSESVSNIAPIDTERASIAMRLVTICGEFIKAGEPQKALVAYHHARDILDGLANSQKGNVDLGLTLSLLHRRIGDLMRARGDWGEAKDAYRSSLAIAERLAGFHPGNAELQRNLAEALSALSTVGDAIGFEPALDTAIKGLAGFSSLQQALVADGEVESAPPAAEHLVEAPAAEGGVIGRPSLELPVEVRDRTASGDPTGQLIHNIPRKMRVGALEEVEVRIARRQEVDAMTMRLRAPGGGFLIEPLSAETCWTNKGQNPEPEEQDFANWRWRVTPLRRGQGRLHLIISAQTLDANRVAAEAALPDQVIKVNVRMNYGRTFRKVAGLGLLTVACGALGSWGRELYPAALDGLTRVWWLLAQ